MDKKKILIVDAEDKYCNKLKAELEKTGKYECEIVKEGTKVAQTAVAFHPYVVFLNVIMPDKRGGEIAMEIQGHEKLKKTRILFMSKDAKKNQAELFLGLVNGIPFHAKPIVPRGINPQELGAKIEELPLPEIAPPADEGATPPTDDGAAPPAS
ncbi:MAG: response regulator [Candidatus Omnitrophota bacterium]|nr:response regulator [Candidatus Omnitrophota bacterium]